MYLPFRKLNSIFVNNGLSIQFGAALKQHGPFTLVFVEIQNHYFIEYAMGAKLAAQHGVDISHLPIIDLDTYVPEFVHRFEITKLPNISDAKDAMRSLKIKHNPKYKHPNTSNFAQSKGYQSYLQVVKQKLNDVDSVLSIDFEMFEHEQSIILELGIAYGTKDQCAEVHHLIVEEHLKYKNGRYVPDHRDKFLFGDSTVVSMSKMKEILQQYISKSSILIAHGVDTELNFCKQFDISLNHICSIDTAVWFKHVHQTKSPLGLANCLKHYQIENDYHHNGGNDAVRTLQLAQQLVNEQFPVS